MPWWERAIPVLVALGVWAWVTGLPFQLDDHTFLRCGHVFFHGGDHAETGVALGGGDYLFRPVLVLWLCGWSLIDGIPLHPGVHHAASLLLHLLAVLLLHALLSRLTERKAAVLGALLFATLPAGGEAIAWIAASGDLMVTAAGLGAACLLTRASVSWMHWLGAGVLAGLGLLAKETMLSLLPILLLMVACRPPALSARRRIRAAGVFLLPVLSAWLFRGWVMGSLSFQYAGGRSLSLDAEQLVNFAGKLPDLLQVLLAPFTPSFEQNHPPALPWPRAFSILLVGLPAVLGAFSGRRGLWALAAFALLLPAPLFAAPPQPGEVFLRSLYLPGAALALLSAFALDTGLRRKGAWRFLALACFAGALVVNGEGVWRMRSLWLEVGGGIKEELRTIEDARSRDNEKVVVVLGSPDGRAGVPMLGNLVQYAFVPPFRDTNAGVLALSDRRALLAEEVLMRASAGLPLTLLEFNRQGGLLQRLDLPAGSADGQAVGPDGEGWWQLGDALAPRAAPELDLSFSAGPAATVVIEMAFAGRTTKRELVLPPSEESRSARLLLDQDEEWMLAPSAPRIRITGATLSASPRAGSVARTLAILQPVEKADLAGGLTELHIAGLPEAAATIAVECHVNVGKNQWMTAFRLLAQAPGHAPGAAGTWRYCSADRLEASLDPQLTPANIGAMARKHLLPLGLRTVVLRVRVEARSADGSALARSEWRHVQFAY